MVDTSGLKGTLSGIIETVMNSILGDQGFLESIQIETAVICDYNYDAGEDNVSEKTITNIKGLIYRERSAERRNEPEITSLFNLIYLEADYPSLKQTDIVIRGQERFNIIAIEKEPTGSVLTVRLAKVTP